eukprot:g11937.t1
MMASEAGSSGDRGRKRKRQRVSFAAGELLEEVKLFHMAKPVNPSIPPPAVDDAGEEGVASQPGLALLGLFGVESPSASSSPLSAAAASSASSSSSSTASASPSTLVAPTTSVAPSAHNGGSQFQPAAASTPHKSEGQGEGGGGGSTSSSSGGDSGGVDGTGTGRAAGSKLFKGFEKTETVVRRKKLVAPPPPPPETPPPLPRAHRYPKDTWPGHKPPNHSTGGGETNGVGGEGAEEEQLEFFCDACDETIPTGVERMECAVCPDEFCLCHRCYDEGEVLDKRHKHELIPSAAPFHVTRSATSTEAALESAKALHVTEAQGVGEVPYDDDDLG